MLELDIAIKSVRKAGECLRNAPDEEMIDAANIALIETLHETFPRHTLVAAEKDTVPNDHYLGEYTNAQRETEDWWAVVPAQLNSQAVSSTYIIYRQPVASAIYFPTEDKLYTAELAGGAELTTKGLKRKLLVSENELSKSVLLVSPGTKYRGLCRWLDRLGIRAIQKGDLLENLLLVAEGTADIGFDNGPRILKREIIAGCFILSEAQGNVTDRHDQRVDYNYSELVHTSGLVYSNGKTHPEALPIIKKCTRLKPDHQPV